MKKIKLTLVFILLACVNFTYAGTNKYDLTQHIPITNSSDWVFEFSMGDLINKSQINETYGALINNELNGFSTISNLLIESNNEYVDFQSKTYAIMHNQVEQYNGLDSKGISFYVGIKNHAKFDQLVQQVVKTNGYQEYSNKALAGYKVFTNKKETLLYNQHQAIFVVNIKPEEPLMLEIISPTFTLAQSDFAKRLNNKKADISIIASMALFNNSEFTKASKTILGVDINQIAFDKVYANINFSFLKGKLEMESELFSDSKKDLNEIAKLFIFAKKSNKKLVNYISDKNFMSLNFALDGVKLAKTLSQLNKDVIKPSNARLIQNSIEYLNQIDGEVAFSLEDLAFNGFVPDVDFKALAVVENSNLFNLIQDRFKSKYEKLNDKLIVFKISSFANVYVGQKNDLFYVTTNQDFAENPIKVKPNIKKARYYKGKQDYGFGVFDYKEIAKNKAIRQILTMSYDKNKIRMIQEVDNVKVSHSELLKGKIEIELNDKNKNALEFFMSFLADL